jgi:hypothetical protein
MLIYFPIEIPQESKILSIYPEHSSKWKKTDVSSVFFFFFNNVQGILITFPTRFLWNNTTLPTQSESRLDNGVISINLSRTFFTGIGHVLEYIDQVLKMHSF